jgi:hypothetical protein
MHLPTVARNPDSSTARKASRVWLTVSIVSAQVVPPLIISAMPRRADARTDAAVCAASIGQTRRLSQSMSERSSAEPRKRVWQRWT